jgi:hypothetical protein
MPWFDVHVTSLPLMRSGLLLQRIEYALPLQSMIYSSAGIARIRQKEKVHFDASAFAVDVVNHT